MNDAAAAAGPIIWLIDLSHLKNKYTRSPFISSYISGFHPNGIFVYFRIFLVRLASAISSFLGKNCDGQHTKKRVKSSM